MKREDFIKLGLEEDMAKQCEAASTEELKAFIPKTRFDEVNGEKKRLEQDLVQRDTQLESLKTASGDVEGMRQQIQTLQTENKTKDEAHAAKIHQLRLDTAVTAAITGARGKNPKAIAALLSLEKAQLAEDGTVAGLGDQLAALAKSDGYLFDTGAAKLRGARLGESGKEGADGRVDTATMTFEEISAYMAENPNTEL